MDLGEAHMRYLSMVGEYGLWVYAQEVYIELGQCFLSDALDTYLPRSHSSTRVHTLRISGFDVVRFLPVFERYFAQFVPTLRSLCLPYVMGDVHEVLEFICKFPHLDNLSLALYASLSTDVRPPPRLSVEHSPPLRGTLVLRGGASVFVRFLLKIHGGLHFQSVNVGGVDKEELGEVLVACSSSLEVFSLHPPRKFTQYSLPSGKIRYGSLNQPCYPAPGAVDLS